ncbi:MAG: hypothetical protein WCG83_07290 [Candidatus Peregrinibacteria bacterium]
MSYKYSTFIGLCSIGLTMLASPAFAALNGTLTDAETAKIIKPCERFELRQQPSCKNRLLTRALKYGSKVNATSAIDIYNQMDLGKAQIRKITTDIRLNNLSTYLPRGQRQTFREIATSPATAANDNLHTLQNDQYTCFMQPSGRPRRLCLENMTDRRQKAMTATGSVQ